MELDPQGPAENFPNRKPHGRIGLNCGRFEPAVSFPRSLLELAGNDLGRSVWLLRRDKLPGEVVDLDGAGKRNWSGRRGE